MENSTGLPGDMAFRAEFLSFSLLWEDTLRVYDPLMNTLMGVGVLGNLAAVLVLCLTAEMRSPTFAYHGALLASYLTFCLTFFALKLSDHLSLTSYPSLAQDGDLQFLPAHTYWLSALFSAILYPALNTASGFMILYMVSFIALDRVIAFLAISSYMSFNKWWVCRLGICISLVLSLVAHSWAPWLTHEITTLHEEGLYTINKRNLGPKLTYALQVKDAVNGIGKAVYPVLILILTIASIYGSRKRAEFRERSLSAASRRRQTRRDFTAFGLMIGVVVLAFIQVIPSEGKRLLEVLHPISSLTETFLDSRRPMEERLWAFRICLYGYEWAKLVANLCTAIERSLAAYLYIFLNQVFRRHLLRLLNSMKHGRRRKRRRTLDSLQDEVRPLPPRLAEIQQRLLLHTLPQ